MKIDELRSWVNEVSVFTSVDVYKWAVDNFYLSAPRKVREMCQNGEIRSLNWAEKVDFGLIKPWDTEVAAWAKN